MTSRIERMEVDEEAAMLYGEEIEEEPDKIRGVGRGSCQPFHRDVVTQLKNFWSAGMVGVGKKKYGEMIELASIKTGLSHEQVKVSAIYEWTTIMIFYK